MSPRCYPPQPEFGRGRTAERRVWEVLRDQLPDEAALLHSVAMIERAAEHEADLIIAWPGVGIAVVEVKGGHVSRHHGQWYQSSGGETRPIKDPVVQAQDCKHVLHRLLVQHGSEAAAARSAHLVAFPFTDIDPGWSYAGCPRDMILARNDLADRGRPDPRRDRPARRRLRPAHRRRAGVAAGGPGRPAARADVAAVVGGGERGLRRPAHPRPGQGGPDPARAAAAEGHRRRGHRQDLAGAGAGPPPRRRRRAGRPGLLLPRPGPVPAADDRRVAARHRPAYVGLFHALPLAWGADPPPDEIRRQSSGYYEERLPAQMGELAARLGEEDKYDAIVVDEAQDFGAAWWPPTLACLRDQDTGGLYAFLDEAQRVFDRLRRGAHPAAADRAG